MIILLSILVILVVILLLRLGADAAYDADGFRLVLIAGPLRLRLFPKQQKKTAKEIKQKTKQDKPKKGKKASEAKTKKSLDLKLLLEIAKLGLQALNRFRICLRVDIFHLQFISGSNDPYKTAMNSAYVSAALNLLAPFARKVFRVKDSRVEVGTDFVAEKPQITARLSLTIQIWQILYIAIAAAIAFIRVWLRHKKRVKENTASSDVKNAPDDTADEVPAVNPV